MFIYYKYWPPLGVWATGRPQMPRLSSPPFAPMTLDETLPATGTNLQADDSAAVTGTGQVVQPLGVEGKIQKLLQASSRFYLAYIVLEFFQLKERFGLLYAKQKALSKAGANNVEANTERVELKQGWKAHQLATVYNTLRFPGALHCPEPAKTRLGRQAVMTRLCSYKL
ncbi:hypothetical protein BDM02DRAFT_3273587 [Thelephora ganbajun]|uniref:Uncharacterized protein n=1 Tax=Thelephora ganbajun TaxID=370292 RepID=A0ACB6YY45_THEGA|nr:hypothetical protein BDM02DRAFT_3273587 [Thelephora ganbajun]